MSNENGLLSVRIFPSCCLNDSKFDEFQSRRGSVALVVEGQDVMTLSQDAELAATEPPQQPKQSSMGRSS